MLFLIFFQLNTINYIFNSSHLVNNEQYPFIHYVKSEVFLLITDSKKTEINYLTYESSAQDTSFQSNKYDEKINSDIGQFALNNIKAYDYFTEGEEELFLFLVEILLLLLMSFIIIQIYFFHLMSI